VVVPEEAKIATGAEEDIEENIEGDKKDKSNAESSLSVRGLVQRCHVPQLHLLLGC